MAIIDVEAMNASLANDYGPTRGPQAADSHEIALYDAHPWQGGVEIEGDGYTRATILPADWSVPEDGATSADGLFGAPTGPGDWDQATHWVAVDPATDVRWDADALSEPLVVTAGGTAPQITVTVYHPDAATGDDEG